MSIKGSEVVTKVNSFLKDNPDTTVASACKALGLKPHQYYNATSQQRAKKLASPSKASVKTTVPRAQAQAKITTPKSGLTMLIVGDAASVASIARSLNA